MKARYVVIGGFLGAGKTTALERLARVLTERGQRVGLITNDQSQGLVDSALLRSRGHPVEEIAGGCFCCRFTSLAHAAQRLEESVRPDVLLAEPVGSCTDLVATVSYPLRRIYGDQITIAPLSVVIDPQRAARILGLTAGRSFSDKVVYVYEKQLEEADLLVVNKCDALASDERERLVAGLRERFPGKEVLTCSARTGEGTQAWFEHLLKNEVSLAPTMEVDYDLYAEGEALLGWLNLTARLSLEDEAQGTFDANRLLVELAERIRAPLDASEVEIAHLKATLDAGDAAGRLAALSLTSSREEPDLREALVDGVTGGELIVNLRAEADPELLLEAVHGALDAVSQGRLRVQVEHQEHFRPAPPEPTHRDAVAPVED